VETMVRVCNVGMGGVFDSGNGKCMCIKTYSIPENTKLFDKELSLC